MNISRFFDEAKPKFEKIISNALEKHISLKVNMEQYALYYLESRDNTNIKSFNTVNKIITLGSNIQEIYTEFYDIIATKMSEFAEGESGRLHINIMLQ